MLSEELSDVGLAQDVITTERKKFFDWNESIAVAKLFPNDSREKDIFLIEILGCKLSKD